MRAVTKALGAILTAAALAAAGSVAATAATTTPAAPSALAADSPSGFSYGTDSWPSNVELSNPYREPVLWGPYGGYIGMAGNWARVEGCKTGNMLAWSAVDSSKANTNYTKYHDGIGTGAYWYMGGPGVDPHYNGTTTEASSVGRGPGGGRARGDEAGARSPIRWCGPTSSCRGSSRPSTTAGTASTPRPAASTRCADSVPATVDRAEFNGFANYITAHSTYKVGVYSSAPVWNSIFGTGSSGSIPNTYEWTYLPETSTVDVLDRAHRLLPARLEDVRAVLRRADQLEQVRADVAVVRRRRHHQQVRHRLRPDRHRADEVAALTRTRP